MKWVDLKESFINFFKGLFFVLRFWFRMIISVVVILFLLSDGVVHNTFFWFATFFGFIAFVVGDLE